MIINNKIGGYKKWIKQLKNCENWLRLEKPPLWSQRKRILSSIKNLELLQQLIITQGVIHKITSHSFFLLFFKKSILKKEKE
jgi:hypothetical protein